MENGQTQPNLDSRFMRLFGLLALQLLMTFSTASAQGSGSVTGTVTCWDSKRGMLYLQDGERALAVKLEAQLPSVRPGERIVIAGRTAPYYRTFPVYPDQPSGSEVLTKFQSPSDRENHFLSRCRGILRVPASGTYTFWLAADDEAELLLGAGADAVSAKVIATVNRSTRELEWDRDSKQKSRSVLLEAGKSYYIETRHREWRGHDHLTVAWQRPGLAREIIAGDFLQPWGDGNPAAKGILSEYWTNCFITRLALLSPEWEEASMLKVTEITGVSTVPGGLPRPQRIRIDQLLPGEKSFQYVEVEGVVSFVSVENDELILELMDANERKGEGGKPITVRMLDWGVRPTTSLNNRRVRVRGVCEPVLNEHGATIGTMIWAQGAEQLTVLDFSDRDSRELELLSLSQLTPTNLNLAWGRKILVRGTVMEHDAKSGRATLRGADSICAFQSSDGTNWVGVGVPVPLALSEGIQVGLIAASLTNAGGAEAKFSGIEPSLTQGQLVGLGGVSTNEVIRFANSNVTLFPAGGNDWVSSDLGNFLYRPLVGEGEIVAKLETFDSPRISDKVGIMMRDSLAADAAYVALVITHSTRLDLMYRPARRTNSKLVNRFGAELPCWLKLVRQQHSLTVQLMAGEKVRINQPVDLVGQLQWRETTPILAEAYVRSVRRVESPVPAIGDFRESRIVDLPSETEESERENYLIRGVVTFSGRAFGRDWLFLQDGSGAASLRASPTFFKTMTVEAGQLLEARGDLQFAPGIAPFRLNTSAVLGWGELPRPAPFPQRREAKSAENRWVELRGIVRAVTNNGLAIMSPSGLISVWIDGSAESQLERYVDCLVTARGVFTSQSGSGPALLVPSAQFVEVVETPPGDPFLVPLHPINKIVSADVDPHLLHRVRVSGVVTYRDEQSIIVQDKTGGARIFGAAPSGTLVGDRVEVVGFPERAGESVTLLEASVRKNEGQFSPEPLQMMLDGILEGRLDSWLVQMDGILLGQKTRQGLQLLELQDGQRAFEAVLPAAIGTLDRWPIGSRIRVTGVTRLQAGNHPGALPAGSGLPLIATMDVLLRTPEDMVLLERPSWWTWRHSAVLGGLMLAVLAAAVVWIRVLRRRVAQRTIELQDTMSKLKRETEVSATLAERERLAAEIHDTLEQGLSGIMMQLDGLDSRLEANAPGARENLEMARRMVRFSRAEVRHSLWNLESQLLKNGDLGAAVSEISRQMSAGSATAVKVRVSANSFPLPPVVEHHLLRCCQEAVSNALKHSGAREVLVNLEYVGKVVSLEIQDDGCGFESSHVLTGAGMHLGLRNLRSRARKIKGQLEIQSQRGQGTKVRLVVTINENGEAVTAVPAKVL